MITTPQPVVLTLENSLQNQGQIQQNQIMNLPIALIGKNFERFFLAITHIKVLKVFSHFLRFIIGRKDDQF